MRTEAFSSRPSTTSQSVLCHELRTMLAVRDIRHRDIAEKIGRSCSYVSSCLHGKQEFKQSELAAIAGVLGVSEAWCSYPGHTLRRLQKLEPVPHSAMKVMLRLAGWQRTRNTEHFTIWEHPKKMPIVPLSRNERFFCTTVTWWIIDTVMGVKLASRFPHQTVWEVQIQREGDVWLVSLPYAQAYFQTTTLTNIRDLITEFVAIIARKPTHEILVDVTLVLSRDMNNWSDDNGDVAKPDTCGSLTTADSIFDNIRMTC